MIAISDLSYRYGKTPVIENWDLELAAGGLYGLLGLNGAGKTSFLKLLAGALIPSKGTIRVFGREPSKRSFEHLSELVFVPEVPLPFASSPRRWLKQYRPFRPAMDVAYWEALLERFAIDPDQTLSKLSFGQRKKFFIASALACGARTILLDEPTNGLDIPSKAEVRRILAEFVGPERIVVISTHQVRDLEAVMDPYIVVSKGHVPLEFSNVQASERLRTVSVASLEGLPVVFASRHRLGWSALVAEPSGPGEALDLELVFTGAVSRPESLRAALDGRPINVWKEGDAE